MSATVTPSALLHDVKIALQIPFDDPATNDRITGFIADGMQYIKGKIGGDPDFLHPGEERTLLIEYVRYYRDAAGDVFENNYSSRIIAARNERRVNESVEGAEQEEERNNANV